MGKVIPVEKYGKGHRVLIASEKGREGGLTSFIDTLCELTPMHI